MSEQPDMPTLTELSRDADPIPVLRAWRDADYLRLRHGFIGRRGGVSSGSFASMNLSHWVGDDPEAVDENWRRIRRELPELKVVARLNQVHGTEVHFVTPENAALRPSGDGMVTAQPGVMLGVYSADCVPILMFDAKRKIAGAFHAGWRGVIAGIADAGVRAMTRLGADVSNIRAAMGPSIGLCCFEVDADLAARFRAEDPATGKHIKASSPGKAYLDLRAIIHDQLARAGLVPGNVTSVGPCTRCVSADFFSRRAASGKVTGLQMSFVGFAG